MLPVHPSSKKLSGERPNAELVSRQGYRALTGEEREVLAQAATACRRLGWIGLAFVGVMVLGILTTLWHPGMDLFAAMRLILSACLVAVPLARPAPWLLHQAEALRLDLRNGTVLQIPATEGGGEAVEVLDHSGVIWRQGKQSPLPFGPLAELPFRFRSGDFTRVSEQALSADEQCRLAWRYRRDLGLFVVTAGAWVGLIASPLLSFVWGRPVGPMNTELHYNLVFLFSATLLPGKITVVEGFRLWGLRRDLDRGTVLVFCPRTPGARFTREEGTTLMGVLPASGKEWKRPAAQQSRAVSRQRGTETERL